MLVGSETLLADDGDRQGKLTSCEGYIAVPPLRTTGKMGNPSPGTQWGDKSRRSRTSWPNKPRGWHGHPHQSADAIGVAGTSRNTNVS